MKSSKLRLMPAAAALVLAGCAYTGDPLPPLANIPARVADVHAIQRGSRIVVEFSLPRLTTEGALLKKEPSLDLRIGPAGTPFDENAWAESARRVQGGVVDNYHVEYDIPAADFVNKEVIVAVRVVGANGKSVGWSNFVIVPVLPTPERPRALSAESVAGGVRLTWQAAGKLFRIYRRQGDAEAVAVGTSPKPEYTDTGAEPGKPYTYWVQTVAPFGEREAVSDRSAEVSITPEDRFPPAVPTGVTALASAASIELTWEPDSEPDLAGYRVYRAAPGEDFKRLAETTAIPSYSDRAVEAGKTYRYVVTAFDKTGNESARSAVAEAALP